MSQTNTVSPLRQHMIEDMAARKLKPTALPTRLRAKPDAMTFFLPCLVTAG